jgi:hypothetical protein
MNPNKRLDVKVSLVITDNEKPFSSSVVTWEDMPYAYVLDIEKKLIGALAELNQLGYEMLDAANSTPSE